MLDQSKRSSPTPSTENEPPEFTELRKAFGRAAAEVEVVRDNLVVAVKDIPVPDAPLIAGRPMRNPFLWARGPALNGDAFIEAIDHLRVDADQSYAEVIDGMFESGDSPWPEEGEEEEDDE